MNMIFAFLFELDPLTLYILGVLTLITIGALGVFTYRLYVAKHRDLLVGRNAEVIEWNDKQKRVKIIGEIWNVKAVEPMMRQPGDLVKVVGISDFDLTLLVADSALSEPSLNTDNPLPISKG